MATVITGGIKQSLTEIRTWDFDFNPDLRGGATVTGTPTAIHIPPSGSASSPIVGAVASGIVPVTLGPVSVTGTHYLDVLATCSDGQKLSMRRVIEVVY